MINYNAAHAHRHVNNALRDLGLHDVKSEDILDVTDDHLGGGYAVTKQEILGRWESGCQSHLRECLQ